MKFTVIECEQRSDEWRAARVGRLTGSRAPHMMARIKSGEAAARRNLRIGMGLERITGNPYERAFSSRYTDQGIDTEPLAIAAYEARTGNIVERTGFLACDSIMAGCSLDGHINDFEGIIEAKCPESATHYGYLKTGEIPDEYRWQCLHNMWVSNAKWVDFVSFDPSFPDDLQYLCVRVNRDEKEITGYELAATLFLAEVAVEVEDIKKLRKSA
jgi:YqaJ-like viral recombinase domain